MEFFSATDYNTIYWTGQIVDDRLQLHSTRESKRIDPLIFHSALVFNRADKEIVYCCSTPDNYQVSLFQLKFQSDTLSSWEKQKDFPRYENDVKETILQLKLDSNDRMLMGSTGRGFVIWDQDTENPIASEAIYLPLPHGVRNITTRMMQSNSIMVSSHLNYAVAGVRKNLYVWCLKSKELVKVLDAHFGRIIQLEALTIGSWNSVITSSIDRSVKVWNVNNIFEQVHVIDRHELQIDNISLSKDTALAVTVTRGCVGVWNIIEGRLLAKLADSPLGAIVTKAEITNNGKYILSSETGKLLIWNRVSEQVIHRHDQPNIQQITFLENQEKILVVSCQSAVQPTAAVANAEEGAPTPATNKFTALATVRTVPEGNILFSFEFNIRMIPGIPFRCAVLTADWLHIVVVAVDKGNKDFIGVYSASNGSLVQKITLKGCNIKVVTSLRLYWGL